MELPPLDWRGEHAALLPPARPKARKRVRRAAARRLPWHENSPLSRAGFVMCRRERRGSLPLWHHLGTTTFGLKRARYGASRPARTQALKGAYEHQLSPLRPLCMSLTAVEQALVRLSLGWPPPMRVSSRAELRLCQHSPRPECRRTHLDTTKNGFALAARIVLPERGRSRIGTCQPGHVRLDRLATSMNVRTTLIPSGP